MALLTQNSELKPHRIWNWSIPAWFTRLPDGTVFKTCPQAGVCAKLCYARNGTYLFRNVRAAHDRNLQLVLRDVAEWKTLMSHELSKTRFTRIAAPRQLPDGVDVQGLDWWMQSWIVSGLPAIRIHDAGDFFADWYLEAWFDVAQQHPNLLFYCYTKEVSLFKRYEKVVPTNFRYLFSTGGLEDHLITETDRHAEVFPSSDVLHASGYESQEANDLLAVLLPTNRIGITANNIPHFNKKMAGRTFGQMTQTINAKAQDMENV